MKKISIKIQITLLTVILLCIGFISIVIGTVNTVNKTVAEAMVEQFTNETKQIAGQAEIILAKGGGIDELQSFVEREASDNTSIAYAVVIDKTVTAVAHSDTEKIGKTYLDDVDYTVDAAQNGTIKTSSFYADVQKSWTYDVMVPIYQDGQLYGSMDVGIYNSEVDQVVANLRNTSILIAAIVIIVIGALIGIFTNAAFHPLKQLVSICDKMGTGDFSEPINKHFLMRTDEVGMISKALDKMRLNLAALISSTADHSRQLLQISETLHDRAENTQTKAVDISAKTIVAVNGSEKQSELTHSNSIMTEEISRGMKEISCNIINVTDASSETSREAQAGEEKLEVVVNQIGEIEGKVSATYQQIQELDKMSATIQNVVQLISDIATQTNLLALNASIEAARAGEHGKGFAVVANEVSNLADQSKNAADDISSIIAEIQGCIEKAVQLMEEGNDSVKTGMSLAAEAKESFQGILGRITQVSDEISNVSAITEEVNTRTESLFASIESISDIAESVSCNTQEVSDAARLQEDMMAEMITQVGTLGSLSRELEKSINTFHV